MMKHLFSYARAIKSPLFCLLFWKFTQFFYFIFNLALNVRYKGKSYRATVEIVRTADRVADFCRKTCIKLECCPNLFGPRMVLDRCSENCSVLTKTKYSRWFIKLSVQQLRNLCACYTCIIQSSYIEHKAHSFFHFQKSFCCLSHE